MNFPTATAICIFALIVAISTIGGYRRSSVTSGQWPFYLKRLLTQPEQVLYHRLVKALPNHIVLAQVQVSRVLGVKKGSRFHEWNNRINRMTYDFVICDKSAAVIAAIELDDKTHESERRRDTDAKKTKATIDAGLKLVRWQVKSLPDEAAIQREIIQKDPSLSVLPSIRAER
jgi:very-short-patch-repair endonuclease